MRVRGIVAALTVALLASGCTGDDDEPAATPSSTTVRTPDKLAVAWSADLGPAAPEVPRDTTQSFRTHGELDLWSTEDTTVVVGRGGLRSFDTATGDLRWSLAVPKRLGHVCAASAEPGSTGVGGLLFATRRSCNAAGVVDLATGRLRWSRPLPPGSLALEPERSDRPLHVGDRVLTVEVPCDEVRRFDLRTGRPLAPPFPGDPDRGCSHDVALGDGVVAYSDKTSDTLTVVDEDTGRRLWRRPLPQGAAESVVSADPLVLGITPQGHGVLRRFDDQGRPGPFIGRQFGLGGPYVVGVLDGVVVLTYALGVLTSPVHRGFDLQTGEQVWRGDDLYVAGEQAGRILTMFTPLGGSYGNGSTIWVGRADPHDPVATQVVLGSMPLQKDATYGWTDDVLVRQLGTEIDVLPLPDPEGDADRAAMPDLPPLVPDPPWASGDVRPLQVADLCTRIRPDSIRALGFRSARLPVPADCTWHDVLDQDGHDRVLSVTVGAATPTDDQTAEEAAQAALAKRRTDDTSFPVRPHPVSGLGDQALVAEKRTRTRTARSVAVRYGNVIVTLHGWVEVYGGPTPPSLAFLAAGERRVLADLEAALADLPPAAGPSGDPS